MGEDGTPGTPVEFLATPFQERGAVFSPDGRWLAYVSDKSGQDEVYVRPYPRARSQEHAVSTGGGREPVWSTNGRELFYRNGEQMLVVRVETESTFSRGTPDILFEGSYVLDTSITGGVPNYDVSDDGRFLMVKAVEDPTNDSSTQVILVQNWTDELQRLVPSP